MQSVSNQVRAEMIKANDDVIKGKQWISTLDNRTTPHCMAYDGLTWDLDDKPIGGHGKSFGSGPPAHFNCRSTVIPLLKTWEELSQGPPALKRKIAKAEKKVDASTRASLGKPVSEKMDYSSWFKRQSEKRQIEILGLEKHKIYVKGNLTFRQMVDQSGNPLTIQELKQKYQQ